MAAGRLIGGRRRRWLPALLVAVLATHLWLGEAVWQMQARWREVEPMPAPLRVSLVRQMQPASRPAPSHTPSPAVVKRMGTAPAVIDALAAAPVSAAASGPDPAPLQALSALPPVVASKDDAEPGPEWPLSTRLSYVLTGNYRGPVNGHAQVEWLRQGRHYQVHLEVAIGPRSAPFMSRQLSSDGRLTPLGIAPRRYDEDTRILFSSRQRRTVSVDDSGVVTFANGRSEAAPPGMQDSASQFVQLTWLFLTGRQQALPGVLVELPLALPWRQYRWGYRVLGEETLQTPIGPLSAWHLQPTVPPGNGVLATDVWLAPSLQYLPVRLLIREDARDNFVDLMLDSLPLQEAPIVDSKPTQENPP